MSHLRIHDLPHLRQPVLLAAFRGWPDAGEVASGAVRFLRRSLQARKFAEIDPQPFYDFTRIRPISRVVGPGMRALSWPSCDFSWWRSPGERDLVLFVAHEPQLQWAAFTSAVLELAERAGVQMLVCMGGTFDGVAHTRPTVITGHATEQAIRRRLRGLGVSFTDYQGPSSIHSALLQAAHERSLTAMSLWGHAPHYITNLPNPKVSHSLLAKAAQLLGFEWDLRELERAAQVLTEQVDQLLQEKPELQEYVRRLEGPSQRSSGAGLVDPQAVEPRDEAGSEEFPAPEAVVRDLEEFLRELRKSEGESGS